MAYHVIRVYWQKRKIGIFRLYNQPRLFLSNVHLFSSMLRPEKVRCSIELLLANRHQFLLIFGDFLGFRPRQNSGMAPNSCVCRPHSRRLASSKTGLSGTWLYTKVGHTIVRYYATGVSAIGKGCYGWPSPPFQPPPRLLRLAAPLQPRPFLRLARLS